MLHKKRPFWNCILQWGYRHWFLTSFGIFFLLLFFVGWYFLIGFSRGKSASYFDSFNNAIWLEHAWVQEEKPIPEIERLISVLGEHHIKHIFVHVGPLESDGRIPVDRFKAAKRFLDIARIYTDKLKFQAWMGQIRNKLNLKDPHVRKNIVDTALFMTQEIGFDGIHYDIEPVFNGDDDFLALLKETKEALPKEKTLSTALSELIPEKFIRLVSPFMTLKNFNSELFYEDVLELTDGVAVMTYESGIQRDWLYRYFVKNQVIWVTRLTQKKKIWIGIPTYEKGDSFFPEAENVVTGLQGVLDGLNNVRSNPETFLGVAIYSYWETQENEWAHYRKLWLNQ